MKVLLCRYVMYGDVVGVTMVPEVRTSELDVIDG